MLIQSSTDRAGRKCAYWARQGVQALCHTLQHSYLLIGGVRAQMIYVLIWMLAQDATWSVTTVIQRTQCQIVKPIRYIEAGMSTVSGLQRSRLDVARFGIYLLHREMMKLNFSGLLPAINSTTVVLPQQKGARVRTYQTIAN